MRPWMSKSAGLGIVGVLLIALGTSLCLLWPTIFRQILQKGLALTPNSRSFDMWKDTNSLPPMLLHIYFFNWTNPHELGVHGKKPHFEQVGPYVYREMRQKLNITFHPENKTVSYFQRRLWIFDEEHTKGSLDDKIIHLNVVATSAAHTTRYWDYSLQKSLSILLTTSKIYIVKTVDELLFKGYPDTLLSMGKMMINDIDIPSYERFGWFYTRNESTSMDGHYNVATGEDDINNLGVMKKWNYRDTVKYHKSPCNAIEGSASEFWQPGRTKDDITLFSVDLCRPLTYEYDQTVSYMGIDGYQFILNDKTLSNSTKRRYPHEQAKFFETTTTADDFFVTEYPGEFAASSTTTKSTSSEEEEEEEERSSESADDFSDDDPDVVNIGHCYCDGECSPYGLMNITACRFGAPVFASLPHFYKTDRSILDSVEGLSPNEKEHEFSITLEPTTGIVLEVAARLQINILLQPSEVISLFHNVPKLYMPIFWFSMKVQVTDEMASNLKTLLALPMVMLCTGVIMAVIGVCIIGIVVLLCLARKQHIAPTEVAIEKTTDEQQLEKKSETMYMDKIAADEDSNVRSDRRLYAKLY